MYKENVVTAVAVAAAAAVIAIEDEGNGNNFDRPLSPIPPPLLLTTFAIPTLVGFPLKNERINK